MCVQTCGIDALTPVESLYSERPSMHTWTTGQSERRTIHTHVDKWAIGTTLAAHVSAATNVQDEGQSQLCLEGSACKCSAGSLANNNIGTCQRVSEFMNRFLQVASSRWRRYAEILEATACKCLVPVEPVASSRWQRDAQRLEDGACRCGVQVASSRWQRDAWRLKGNACKCWMAVASRTWQRDAQK